MITVWPGPTGAAAPAAHRSRAGPAWALGSTATKDPPQALAAGDAHYHPQRISWLRPAHLLALHLLAWRHIIIPSASPGAHFLASVLLWEIFLSIFYLGLLIMDVTISHVYNVHHTKFEIQELGKPKFIFKW